MLPYLDPANVALIGRNTSGKPVGQFGFDLAECDLRVRAVAFQTLNADDGGDYFTGLANSVPNTCRAIDDISRPLGDRDEASVSVALDFLAGRTCTAITGGKDNGVAQRTPERIPLQGAVRTAAQQETPGLF